MTTITTVKVKCAICGASSEQDVLMSTNTFGGFPDLDFRPPEMMRSTIGLLVQNCASCGYCAPDISTMIEGAKAYIEGNPKYDFYSVKLIDKVPELVRSFYCASLLFENKGDYVNGGRMALNAAWASDDANHRAMSKQCRSRAYNLLDAAQRSGLHFSTTKLEENLMLIDICRRASFSKLAIEQINENLKGCTDEDARKVLEYQKHLIEFGDSRCHTIEGALQFADKCEMQSTPSLKTADLTEGDDETIGSELIGISPIALTGSWDVGWALDLHTVSSVVNPDGSFSTQRTELGELVYRSKYCGSRDSINEIAQEIAKFMREKSALNSIDLIIPVPPSKLDRSYQPVIELAKVVGIMTDIPVREGLIHKIKDTAQVKAITDPEERARVLNNAFAADDDAYLNGKDVLLIDDLYRSGVTLNEICRVLKAANASKIVVITATKTRVNR